MIIFKKGILCLFEFKIEKQDAFNRKRLQHGEMIR